jgi:DNA-binding MltR family transcriptional regulator
MTSIETFRTYFSESDRGGVLIVAEELDTMLKDLHLAHIESVSSANSDLKKRLFSFYGPIGNFAARIQLAYVYGLISKPTYEDLERLREIRNVAAHTSQNFSFHNIIEKILAMKAVERNINHLQLTADEQVAVEKPDSDEKTMKLAFASTAMAIANEILTEHTKILHRRLNSFKSAQSQ